MPPELPLSGLIDFRAKGAGTFDEPQFEVTGTVRDLFVADEGIGEITVKSLVVKGDVLTVDGKVFSSRLDVDVNGQVMLNDRMDGQLKFTVNDTSLDPYLRAFDPRLSPYTTAIVSGTIDVKGPLAQTSGLDINAHVSTIDMRLFDYRLRNAGAFDIEFDSNVVRIPRARPLALYGDDTKLEISGEIGLEDETHTILGVTLPKVRIPIRPGRSVATIIEVAARNHVLKRLGRHSAREVAARLDDEIARRRRLTTTGEG